MAISLENLKILIVEDNAQAALLLRRVLGALGVHQIYRAADGREAQKFLNETKDQVDLIICDWEMPHMTGLELLQQVRTVYADMPFMMLTGNAEADSVKAAIKFGVNAYIKKPFSPQQLTENLLNLAKAL